MGELTYLFTIRMGKHKLSYSLIYLPYIRVYRLQNLQPNLDQKVGRATYMRVMTRQAIQSLTFLPPLWQPAGQLCGAAASTHTVDWFTTGLLPSPLQSIDGVCSLFLSLPWSASLSVERGEPFGLAIIS